MDTAILAPGCCLTTKDFAVLEAMLARRRAFADPIVSTLEDKLSRSRVVSVDGVAPDVVTLNSRVIFRVDAGPAETRTLVQNEARGPVGSSLELATRRGMSMLGLAEGQSVVVELADGRRERIAIEQVLYQPEAARRAARDKLLGAVQRPNGLRLVYSAPLASGPLGETAGMRQTMDDDDPGPSAA